MNHIDPERDFVLGAIPAKAELVLYGDYTCPETGRIRDIIKAIGKRLDGDIAYAYRQLPAPARSPGSEKAAKAALAAAAQQKFWDMHDALFELPPTFDDNHIVEAATSLGLDASQFQADIQSDETSAQLRRDRTTAQADDVVITPSLFINGRRYEDVWDERAILDAIEQPLARRIKSASEDFFNWAASAGLVLIVATLAALAIANLGFADWYRSLVDTPVAISIGDGGLSMPLVKWVNDAFMAVFFLLVGIEIKREILAGELSDPSAAALPIIGAVGGMVVPALLYAALTAGTDQAHGWGVPMATDIAFTLGLVALLSSRVPTSLKVFLSALAVADDMGAVIVIALFYGHGFHLAPFVGAIAILCLMGLLNWSRILARTPYVVLGVALWWFVHDSGLHATLAGVLTAALIPSRRIENIEGVAAQTSAILRSETNLEGQNNPIRPHAFHLLKAAVEGLREPGFHLERALNRWTNFLILPLFAFLNTGVLLTASGVNLAAPASMGVLAGLLIGKPLGIFALCWIAIKTGVAKLSAEISWAQLLGAACLCGVGFTMSIFIATAAFEGAALDSVKLSILGASTLAAIMGLGLLYFGHQPRRGSPQ